MTKARDLGDFISDGTIAETVTADGLNLGDNEKIQLGASQDLQIYHSGAQSFISDQGTGTLIVLASGLDINNAANTENMLTVYEDGALTAYHNGSPKLATSSTGATVTGTIAVSGDFNATSGTFTVQSNGTDILNVTSTLMSPQTDGAISLGSASNAFNNLHLDGAATVSGNVHITDNANGPDAALHIEKTTPQLRLQLNGNSGYNTIESVGGNELSFGRSGTEQMRIDSGGNVGIGRTDPADGKFSDGSSALVTSGSAANIGSTHFATNSDDSSFIGMWSGHSGADPALAVKSTKSLTFGNWPSLSGYGGFTERMRIGPSGQLGLSGANYGTSGQVLTSGGSGAAPAWADAGGGAFEVLSDTSFTSAGDVEFTITAGRVYKFEFLGITVNNTSGGGQMLWRASSNGGVSFDTIYYSVRRSYSSATSFSSTNGNGNYGSLTYFNAPQSLNYDTSFNGEMFYYQRSGHYPFANSMFQNGDSTPGTSLGGYRVGTTSTVNLLRFQPNSSSIAGRIRVLRSV